MPQINPSLAVIALAAILALNGCGDKNSKAVGEHPSDWTATHKATAKANLEACVECHGENLDGGIAKISCTQCHQGSAADFASHPTQWATYAYARHKAYVTTNGTATCANAACHGSSLQGGSGGGPGCTTCHIGGAFAKHPADWTVINNGTLINPKGHSVYAVANGSDSCKNAKCHGSDAKGIFLSGPSCYLCHQVGPTGKHPADRIVIVAGKPHFRHDAYLTTNSVATCTTNTCHGVSGVGTKLNGVEFGPSCTKCHP